MTTRATNNQGKTMHIEKFLATVIQLWQIMEIEINEGRKKMEETKTKIQKNKWEKETSIEFVCFPYREYHVEQY